MMVEQTIV